MSDSDDEVTKSKQKVINDQSAGSSKMFSMCAERLLYEIQSTDSKQSTQATHEINIDSRICDNWPIIPVRVDSKAAVRSRLYRERHREEINQRRREIRQRKKNSQQIQALSDIQQNKEVEQIIDARMNNRLSSNSHTLRQQRYYDRHREELNKRKRESRFQQKTTKSIPASAGEHNGNYRERNSQIINKPRRNKRVCQQNFQRVHIENNINIIDSMDQIINKTPNNQQNWTFSNYNIIQEMAQNSTSTLGQNRTQCFEETTRVQTTAAAFQAIEDNVSNELSSQALQYAVIETEELGVTDNVPDNVSLYCDDNTNSATSKGDKDEYRHEGYQCDNCNGNINGYRYTCVQCNNFDLCFVCESRGAHALHYMLRVPEPRPYNEIQTVLATIRKYLMGQLGPISTTEFDTEDTISLKSEIKLETMDGDIEDAEQNVETPDENDANYELRQHSRLSSDEPPVHLTSTDFKEVSLTSKPFPRQVQVSNVKQEITQNPIQRVRLTKNEMEPIEAQVRISNAKQEIAQNPIQEVQLTKNEMEPTESQVKISNAKDTNQGPFLVMKMAKQGKVVTLSTAKRKIVINNYDLVGLEQSNLLAKKICVMPSTTPQETRTMPTILAHKSDTTKPAVKLLNTLEKQGQTASSQLRHQHEPQTTSADRKS